MHLTIYNMKLYSGNIAINLSLRYVLQVLKAGRKTQMSEKLEGNTHSSNAIMKVQECHQTIFCTMKP